MLEFAIQVLAETLYSISRGRLRETVSYNLTEHVHIDGSWLSAVFVENDRLLAPLATQAHLKICFNFSLLISVVLLSPGF